MPFGPRCIHLAVLLLDGDPGNSALSSESTAKRLLEADDEATRNGSSGRNLPSARHHSTAARESRSGTGRSGTLSLFRPPRCTPSVGDEARAQDAGRYLGQGGQGLELLVLPGAFCLTASALAIHPFRKYKTAPVDPRVWLWRARAALPGRSKHVPRSHSALHRHGISCSLVASGLACIQIYGPSPLERARTGGFCSTLI
ncbi:hypothetical protein BDV96DRAFT_628320 [Lophiotrema nucula]|uniref:Uncharacterized protein n=1 Tax=Lophiotrema nucula TaxID=690887 RepID=A0A6A5ZPQ8_9PLEO|nr:hypothetical protein BDV96DRAFT_628320 [Lophiotrema nucula]